MEKSMPENEERHLLLPKPQPRATVVAGPSELPVNPAARWTAEGIPLQAQSGWGSGLFSCFGSNDEFWSSDLEVCCLGSFLPCILYGSNVERLRSDNRTFTNHCLTYTGLYLLGNAMFGWNCLAPCFAFQNRTAIRRTFNLEGGCESCGCCGSIIVDDGQREKYESFCDFTTHFFCHPCALCQEGRQLRRRLPHPGFTNQLFLMTLPPQEQTMGRNA